MFLSPTQVMDECYSVNDSEDIWCTFSCIQNEIYTLVQENKNRVQGAVPAQEASRSYPTFKVRRGGGEEIPLVQSEEQWLPFAGAAMKRYPTFKVRKTQVRQ